MTTKRHFTYMLVAGVAVLGGLWAFGVSLSTAIPYAFLLACPLMMVFMMRGMDHGSMGHGSMGHGAPAKGAPADGHQHAASGHEHSVEPGSPDLGSIDEQYRR
jgi:hypothetical protein